MSRRALPSVMPEPRGAARHKVFLPAEMTDADGAARVHLLNLSPAGALVHGDAVPAAGEVVQFSCRGARWQARVVWARQKRFGVVHVPPLAPAALDALVAG